MQTVSYLQREYNKKYLIPRGNVLIFYRFPQAIDTFWTFTARIVIILQQTHISSK